LNKGSAVKAPVLFERKRPLLEEEAVRVRNEAGKMRYDTLMG